jgi:hypothetical protein
MKNVRQNFRRWAMLPGTVCLIAFALSSCAKKDINNVPPKALAGFSVIDACPDAPTLDLYIGGQQVNLSPIALGNYFNYFNVYAGKSAVVFYQSGTTTLVAKDTVSLPANHVYTLFLANLKANPDFILTTDSLAKPASGTISVRLVNASPDAGAVDLVVKGASNKIIQNATYKTVSPFTAATVTATDSLQVRQAGTTTVLATVPASNLAGSAVYTVWLYGLANTAVAAQKLKAGIMLNAMYY